MAMRAAADRETHVVGTWVDGEFALRRCWRDTGDGVSREVLTVCAASPQPNASTLERLAHEYGLRDELDATWALQPLELVEENGRTTLVLQDGGGMPLVRLLGAPMELGAFLRLAIAIAAALGQVHHRGLVHKDIKPANIFVDLASDQVRLTGFGLASRLPRERQTLEPPETIAGTLAYMAPEQTGRINRSVDSRSDLYSLGVTVYEMLTGSLPFTASDPMEWIHCHIARQALTPNERLETVPGPISEVVMKLLAKTAEERYQTAAGLERDLQRCLADWEAHGCIEDFPLGQHDTPDRLLIPEKLYGRAREVETLLASFDRIVKSGAPELVLVCGYSGIGKSSVINELHKALASRRGLFASSKFDQYKRDIPYSTLGQSFQSLVRPLLGKSDSELAVWRGALLEALDSNARLITDLIPELKLIIGEQPPVPELAPLQAQSRFQLVFRRFIGVFARPEHPLALFLDDLQWLDAATLDLLEDLLTRADLKHLMLIGAYRDNEVGATHPLARKLDVIRQAGTPVQEIRLKPLPRDDLEQLIVDALHCERERTAPLAQLVHDKTLGNPFFVIQFLRALAEEGLLAFDHDAACWSWDLDRIHAKGYTDNVVDLMIGQLTRLPVETQQALQRLACLGNIAEITMLTIVLGAPEERAHVALWPAVRQDLVERLDGAYRFTHDRVQEAAYALIPQELRAEVHLRIGRLLAAQTPPEKREEAIFEFVNHLNRGATLIAGPQEREQLAEFNLIAGKRAKGSTAYASALAYLDAGAALLPEECWERRRDLIFALELNRAECEFLTGDLTAAEERLSILAFRAATVVDKSAVACLQIILYQTLNRPDRAVEIGLDYLREVGIAWPPHPKDEDVREEYQRMWRQLGARPIEAIFELPLMVDLGWSATMRLLMEINAPAYFTDTNLWSLVQLRMANLSIEHGNSDGSCYAYAYLNMITASRFGDHRSGYRFGRLSVDLVEKKGLERFKARVYLGVGQCVFPWTRHLREGLALLRRGWQAAFETGDFTYMAYGYSMIVRTLFYSGAPLDEVQREAANGIKFAEKMRFGFVIDVITPQLRSVKNLKGMTSEFGSFSDDGFDEGCFERRLENTSSLSLAASWYWIRKLQAHYYAGDYRLAVVAAAKAQTLLWTTATLFEEAEYHFYAALARAAASDSATQEERLEHFRGLGEHHQRLVLWAENCPENFENRAALVGAEIARIEGRDVDAMRLYEGAIRSARANGFIDNEALAYEVAARFYAARGFEEFARTYLRKARYGYLRWGAVGKARQLEEIYPHLRTAEPAHGPTSTIAMPLERLDLATVIKVSQAVSGEIVLEKLIKTLMRTAIEQAGAERGLLILAHGPEQRIAAEAMTSGDMVRVQLRDEPVTASVLPEAVLRYVLHARETVTLDDASAQPPFADDSYIRERQARSILCLPLINQAKLIGVLYLENNLAPCAFAPARIAVLNLLASQAAISLENTRLYGDLEQREAKIRRLVDANIIGIFIWELKGRILEANDAFLRMLGFDREDLASGRLRWTDLTPPEWFDRDAQHRVPELKMTGSLQPFEKEYFRKDGSRVPVLVGAAAFEQDGSEGVAFVLDLTERNRVEKALRESEEQWKAVFENNPTMYFMVDASGAIVSVNPFGAERLGFTVDELIGLPVRNLVHAEDREAIERNTAICFERPGQTVSWEARKIHKNGAALWVREIARVMLIKDRPVALTVCEDITERKRMSEALLGVQTELEHANRVATMGQLTASIAHEVNQPIAAARNNAASGLRFLSRNPPDLAEVREALECVVNDADRAGDVIGRIRDLVKKAPPRKDPLDINEAIRQVIVLARGEAMKAGVSVRTQLAEGLPLIQGDRVQLQQVVLNLILNAVEAMSSVDDASRLLSFSTERRGADEILVAVRDSGPGIDPEHLERVFASFYTTKPSGMGMGLSICRSIIEAHGGRLWAEAHEPRGTIFQFTVPTHLVIVP